MRVSPNLFETMKTKIGRWHERNQSCREIMAFRPTILFTAMLLFQSSAEQTLISGLHWIHTPVLSNTRDAHKMYHFPQQCHHTVPDSFTHACERMIQVQKGHHFTARLPQSFAPSYLSPHSPPITVDIAVSHILMNLVCGICNNLQFG